MINPDTNCAPKLASNSAWLCCSKACSTSRCRPKTLTSSWPVNDSSMCPLSRPVCFHCATNWPCERFAIAFVTNTESGTVTSAIAASSGEIRNIIDSTPATVSNEVSSWLIVCDRVCEMLSMSLVTRLRISPRPCSSKYGSGSRFSLSSTSRRSRSTVRCTTPLRTKPCSAESTEPPT
jgi:hypothetical protein